MRTMSYPETRVYGPLKIIDGRPADDLRKIVFRTYTKAIFGSEAIVPLKKLEDGLFIP